MLLNKWASFELYMRIIFLILLKKKLKKIINVQYIYLIDSL